MEPINDQTYRKVYEECLDIHKIGWTINLSTFSNAISKRIEPIDSDASLSDIIPDLNKELPKIISVTKKAHNLSLYHNTACDVRENYIHGFHSFSYEEFLSLR